MIGSALSSSLPPDERWPRWTWLLLLAFLLPPLLGWSSDPAALGHDEAMYLVSAGLLLEGRVPYRDFFELNPPLIMYLCVPPVALARVLGAPPAAVWSLLVIALAAVAVAAFALLLRALRPLPPARDRWLLTAAFAATALAGWKTGTLGQREGLLVLALGPWLAVRAGRHDGAGAGAVPAAIAGAAAGLAFALKPHFLLLAVAPEAAWLAGSRRLRALVAPETVAAAAIGLGYAAHFALLPAEARTGFFSWLVPLVRAGYGAYAMPLAALLARSRGLLLLGAIVGLAAAAGSRLTSLRRLVAPLLALAAAAIAIALLQRKGWDYQWLPARLGLALLGAIAVSIALELVRRRAPRLGFAGPLAAVSGAIVLAAHLREPLPSPASYRAIERWSAPGDPVLILSSCVADSFPALLASGRRPASRYLWMFPLPLIEEAHRGEYDRASGPRLEPVTADEARFVAELVADLRRSRPPLVLVEPWRCLGCRPETGFRRWVLRMRELREAFAGYVQVGTDSGFDVLVPADRVSRRSGATAPPREN